MFDVLPANLGCAGSIIVAAVAMVILRLEVRRRGATAGLGNSPSSGYGLKAKTILRECAPEVGGIFACFAFALALRARGDHWQPPAANAEAWEKIKSEWPLLMTADTLLSLQTMLRLVIFSSATLRMRTIWSSPLADEASVLWFGAGLARVALLSQCDTYYIDGPLGGLLPCFMEVALLPLMAMLCLSQLRRSPSTTALTVIGASFLAHRNRLSFNGEGSIDALWSLAHIFEFLAAVIYFLRACLMDSSAKGDASVSFTAILLPLQQSLAAYYFHAAFDPVEQLVGAGIPFEMLRGGAVVQLACYLSAAAVHFSDEVSDDSTAPRTVNVY